MTLSFEEELQKQVQIALSGFVGDPIDPSLASRIETRLNEIVQGYRDSGHLIFKNAKVKITENNIELHWE